jgi:hypothetical protein
MTEDASAKCRHLWQPMADQKAIWQHCVKCGKDAGYTTHADIRMDQMAYILRDLPKS